MTANNILYTKSGPIFTKTVLLTGILRLQKIVKLKGWKFRAALIVGVVTLGSVVFLLSPYFHVQEVIILGNDRVTTADIRTRLEISYASNILLIDTAAARRRVMANLLIGDVNFERDLPGRLYVTVHERRPSAYVRHTPGNLLVLDDHGRVLEIRTSQREALPFLEGLQFSRVQLGEILDVANATDFVGVVLYTQLLIAHGLINEITHINVSDPENIRILIDYTEFHVGGTANADMKVRTIAKLLEIMPDANLRRGIAHMQNVGTAAGSDFFFELLQ